GKILGDRPHRAIATDVAGEPGVRRFLLALAELAIAGFELDTDVLFAGRAEVVDTNQLPIPAPGWKVDGHLVRTVAGEVVAGSLQPADEFPAVSTGGLSSSPEREATVLEHLRSLREIVATEREVMLAYLGAPVEGTVPVASPLTPVGPGTNGDAPAIGQTEALPAAPGPESPPPTAVRGDALLALVLQLVADRTGYPTDMLDPDLDLEADLSIDSIKRIEIIGDLAERIGLDAQGDDGIDDSALEALAQLKSLREIVNWIDGLEPIAATGPEAVAPAGTADPIGPPEENGPVVPAIAARHIVMTVEVDPPATDRRRLDGQTILVADDTTGVGQAVAADLEDWGASVSIIEPGGRPTQADLELLRAADALIWLRALHPAAASDPVAFDARAAFAWWQPAILGRARVLITATAGAGSFASDPSVSAPGLGLAGMAKAISRELADRRVRVVDLDPHGDPDFLATCIVDELFDTDHDPVEVGYYGVQRVTRIVVPESLATSTPEIAVDDPPLRSSDPVVLLTGGARGITARAAVALAGQGGCRLELAGRSPLPGADEDPAFASGHDLPSLRRLLIDTGGFSTPAAVEAECSRLLAEREIRATLAVLGGLGAEVHYHQVDVRDAEALAGVVRDIYGRFGRLDTVV
ncbi:MAG TPA: phosphopantetheine-binding protein, partial [Acidimicrobiales bacterium]|nr:phosphopantetheine-binding protein [Acidimicrobiales bacterium]